MAAHTVKTVTKKWVEVRVATPCTGAEINSALEDATNMYREMTGTIAYRADEALEVRTDGDKVIISFQVQDTVEEGVKWTI